MARTNLKSMDEIERNSFVPPKVELDERIKTVQHGWQIKEALLYSYHWGYPTVVAEDFIKMQREHYITAILSNPDTGLFIKQAEAKSYLGTR